MRLSTEVRKELDLLNAERVALDQSITRDRERLNEMNAKASALETEFQQADAAEQQAKLAGG